MKKEKSNSHFTVKQYDNDSIKKAAVITAALFIHKTPKTLLSPKKTSHSNISDISSIADYITQKIETLGSIFRHETVGLLPSFITI